jgi:copper chaperone CopZ
MEDYQNETISLPAMYGDHHVVQVRQVVSALPGVKAVQASASRRKIYVTFSPSQLTLEAICAALAKAGFAPGVPAAEAAGAGESLPVVAAADQVHIREAKYTPPPAFGVCPGLETRYVGVDHPADRK